MTKNEPTGCLTVLCKLFGLGGPSKPGISEPLPYQCVESLMTHAERSFYGVLLMAADGQIQVFSKVRLADIISVKKGTEKRQSHFNRIQSKHVDFLLCDPDDTRPLLVIELDDASHKRAERKDRDAFVDQALDAAGLPILRIPAQRTYSPNELAASINECLAPPHEAPSSEG